MFTKVGQVLAYFLFFGGLLDAAMGFWVVYSFGDDPEALAHYTSRFLGNGTSGEEIDEALTFAFSGLVLGILVEISRKLSNVKANGNV